MRKQEMYHNLRTKRFKLGAVMEHTQRYKWCVAYRQF